MSDCYFGLDIEKDVKYEVGVAKKIIEQTVENEVEEESYIRKLLNFTTQDEEEVSDKEDEEDKKQLKEK